MLIRHLDPGVWSDPPDRGLVDELFPMGTVVGRPKGVPWTRVPSHQFQVLWLAPSGVSRVCVPWGRGHPPEDWEVRSFGVTCPHCGQSMKVDN